jgi:hypothetical protein
VVNGDYVPKWKLDNAINACNKMEQRADDFENDCGHYDRIRDLENTLHRIKTLADYEKPF